MEFLERMKRRVDLDTIKRKAPWASFEKQCRTFMAARKKSIRASRSEAEHMCVVRFLITTIAIHHSDPTVERDGGSAHAGVGTFSTLFSVSA
jgi:hypothetical protein